MWWHGASIAGVKRALRVDPRRVPAALIVLVIWWLANRAEVWIAMRSGQINAWFIARFGWDDVSWLFTAIGYVADWFRWVIAALLALSLMAGFVAIGWRALAQAGVAPPRAASARDRGRDALVRRPDRAAVDLPGAVAAAEPAAHLDRIRVHRREAVGRRRSCSRSARR